MSNLSNHDFENRYELIIYHRYTRCYRFMLYGDHYGLELNMTYCPWCGRQLSQNLGEEWCEVIKEEVNLDEVFAER